MSEQNEQAGGTGIELNLPHIESLGDKTEGARHAKAMLRDVARTLSGVTCEVATELHREFAEQFGRMAATTKKVKAAGAVVKWSGEADFAKAGFRPPFLMSLAESGQHVFKLRKLGAFPADVGLAVDVATMRTKHAERWEKLAA